MARQEVGVTGIAHGVAGRPLLLAVVVPSEQFHGAMHQMLHLNLILCALGLLVRACTRARTHTHVAPHTHT
jgi:hypothetical protein